jgi:hypothetical protein
MEWSFEYPAKVEQDEAGFTSLPFPTFRRRRPTAVRASKSSPRRPIAWKRPSPAGSSGATISRGPSRTEPNSLIVALPALYALKAALYLAGKEARLSNSAKEARLSKSALAAKLGKEEGKVARLLDPSRPSPALALEAALRAVGKSVHVIVADTRRRRG